MWSLGVDVRDEKRPLGGEPGRGDQACFSKSCDALAHRHCIHSPGPHQRTDGLPPDAPSVSVSADYGTDRRRCVGHAGAPAVASTAISSPPDSSPFRSRARAEGCRGLGNARLILAAPGRPCRFEWLPPSRARCSERLCEKSGLPHGGSADVHCPDGEPRWRTSKAPIETR